MAKIHSCGCAINAIDGSGRHICPVHLVYDIMEAPDLSARKARCAYCAREAQSDVEHLAFFEYRPAKEFDMYYCGCRGWD